MKSVTGKPPANTNMAQSHGLSSVIFNNLWTMVSYKDEANEQRFEIAINVLATSVTTWD